ncbi:kinetochore-associated Ndc80 complex subunit nuf2 [Elasticomyces elasticus]|nr:kinetochore-associated Ndc80 complex subunit nuf2 [Elasticomyces elasticus]
MDYNPRMSMARSSQQSSQQRQKKEEPEDAFMTLPDREIAGCITDIGISFTIQDLQKPNPQQIQKAFEFLNEILTSTTRETVAPAMKAAADDLCGDEAERVFTADTRELMGFFVMLRKALMECGITDFTFSDLYRPTHPRLVRIFSHVINFIRFRESQTAVIDEHFNASERTKRRIEELYAQNQDKSDEVEEMQRNAKNVERAVAEKEKRYEEMKMKLKAMSKEQESITEKLERVKEEQSRLKNVLQEKTARAINTKQEASKLRPYTQQSPAALEAQLRELNGNLSADKAQIEACDRRARVLQTSSDTFAMLNADIKSLTKLLEDLQTEINREDEEAARAGRNRDSLSNRSNEVRDVERQERQLQKRLENVQKRTEKLRAGADAKAEEARRKMEELRATHKELQKERSERGEEVERRRIRIEQTEKMMVDLKENIEDEVQSAREEYMKMESHIRLYVTEMEQSI